MELKEAFKEQADRIEVGDFISVEVTDDNVTRTLQGEVVKVEDLSDTDFVILSLDTDEEAVLDWDAQVSVMVAE